MDECDRYALYQLIAYQLTRTIQVTGGKESSLPAGTQPDDDPTTQRYVLPTEIDTFGSVEDRQEIISTGWMGRTWAANYTTATRLPLHPSMGPPNTPYPPERTHFTVQNEYDMNSHVDGNHPLSHAAISFVHGGLSPTYSNLAPFPSRINDLASSLLRKLQRRTQPPPHPPNPYPGLPDSANAYIDF